MSLALPRRSFLATVAAGLLGAGAPALAQPRKTPVALAGSEAATAPELTRALEAAVLEELAHTDSVRLVPENRAAFRLRASVTSLETRRRGADEHLLCAVSVLVEDRRTGAMRAVLEGRARAEGPLGSVDRESVVRAAVHGALRPIATALGVPGHRG
ncbi:MAG: hypothetical protein U0230_10555 [Polyangiales bacterium]